MLLSLLLRIMTPEYPEGRPLVIVANDCTVQSGSFGVQEDEFYDKVSKYARASGEPPCHSSNNGQVRFIAATVAGSARYQVAF